MNIIQEISKLYGGENSAINKKNWWNGIVTGKGAA